MGALGVYLHHGCAKWRTSNMPTSEKQDCSELGTRYWRLIDAVARATVSAADKKKRESIHRWSERVDKYVSEVNPKEVREQIKQLRELNAELAKKNPNPGIAFLAGGTSAEMAYWLLHHCPTELAWGLPTKMYATALTECSELEPELRAWESNVGRLLSSIPSTFGK